MTGKVAVTLFFKTTASNTTSLGLLFRIFLQRWTKSVSHPQAQVLFVLNYCGIKSWWRATEKITSWKGTFSPLPILPAQVWICFLSHLEVIQSLASIAQSRGNNQQKLWTAIWDAPASYSLYLPSDTHHLCNSSSDYLFPPQPTSYSFSVAQQDLLKPLRPTHSFHYIMPPRDWPWNHLTWSWQAYLEGLCKWVNCFTPLLLLT